MARPTKKVKNDTVLLEDKTTDKDVEALFKKHKGKIAHLGLAGDNKKKIDVISTGSLQLDHKIPFGGIPQGRITHIYGPTRSLKTTLAGKVIKSAYDKYKDPLCMILDLERTQDSESIIQYYMWLGFTEEQARSIIIARDVPEALFDLAKDFVQHPRAAVLLVDSIGAMEPSSLYDKNFDENAKMAGRALLLKRFINTINTVNNNCAVILINQVMDNFNQYGSQYTYGGGNSLKHMSSLTLDVKGLHSKDDKTDKGAINTKINLTVRIEKCKIGGENQQIPLVFDLKKGDFDKLHDALSLGYELGLLIQSGSWYYLAEEPNSDSLFKDSNGNFCKVQGQDNFHKEISDNYEFLSHIEVYVKKVINENREQEFSSEAFLEDDDTGVQES